MELTANLVRRFCMQQMIDYMDCVDAHPTKADKRCQETKSALATCAQQHPMIESITKTCGQHFYDYEKCVQEHPHSMEKCVPSLEAFTKCAHQCQTESGGFFF
ncbi:hypothetical protein CAPTEDRAFT_116088 [Capitella teleta]|uniref:IMS import disulfide relay-system CHCH-CHCH-like Cx9C domain-containing protein n=1 Tax=Capitella teleta TaxID=283909 RepID=R7TFN8_CAPTE|nr:hypothetical protein CAPTEDRAFT_116088 [Capitella teleta]|eukprot:ELT89861.1 hypothetical protein CAPTEDRAFT_116088 [Capitella teleta]